MTRNNSFSLKKQRKNIDLTYDLKRELTKLAADQDMNLKEYIEHILGLHVKNRENEAFSRENTKPNDSDDTNSQEWAFRGLKLD